MCTGRHADGADALRIVSAARCLRTNHPHRPLAVFPGTLVYGKPYRTGRTIDQAYALNAHRRKLLAPHIDQGHVTTVLVSAAGNQDHTGTVGPGGLFEPFQIRGAVIIGPEAFRGDLAGHRGNLMPLRIRHHSLRPDRNPLLGTGQGAEEQRKKSKTFHTAPEFNT